jgi:hypothetical protein
MIHCAHVASGFDLDSVAGLYLHFCDVIGGWAYLILSDRSH